MCKSSSVPHWPTPPIVLALVDFVKSVVYPCHPVCEHYCCLSFPTSLSLTIMAGLYAGITFNKDGAGPVSTAAASTSASASATPVNVDDNRVSRSLADTLGEASKHAAEQAEIAAKDAADKEKKAALAFGPAIRRKAAPKAKPAIAFSAGATIVGAPTMYVASLEPSTSALPSSGDAPGTGSAAGLTGRTLAPPSMTLDSEDVNGFKGTAAGKKANRNNKKKGKRRKEEDPAFAWTAEYDPTRPTDYVGRILSHAMSTHCADAFPRRMSTRCIHESRARNVVRP